MPKVISLILTILFVQFCSIPALADPVEMPPSIDAAKFTFLDVGMVAPFPGILLMPEAMGRILADSEFALKQMELEHKYKLMEMEAGCSMEKDKLHSSIDIEKQLCEERLTLKEEKYEKLLDESQGHAVDTLERALWGGGGFLLGVGLAVGTTYIVMEATR
jgi:hypothetical protein